MDETKDTRTAEATFTVAAWDETVVLDIDGTGSERSGTYYPDRGITRAEVRYRYQGDLEGEGVVHYLMTYGRGEVPIVAFEHFTGTIGGREGSCVLKHLGGHDQDTVTDSFEVVPGLGTGGLETLRGEGAPVVDGHSDDGYRTTLRYTF